MSFRILCIAGLLLGVTAVQAFGDECDECEDPPVVAIWPFETPYCYCDEKMPSGFVHHKVLLNYDYNLDCTDFVSQNNGQTGPNGGVLQCKTKDNPNANDVCYFAELLANENASQIGCTGTCGEGTCLWNFRVYTTKIVVDAWGCTYKGNKDCECL